MKQYKSERINKKDYRLKSIASIYLRTHPFTNTYAGYPAQPQCKWKWSDDCQKLQWITYLLLDVLSPCFDYSSSADESPSSTTVTAPSSSVPSASNYLVVGAVCGTRRFIRGGRIIGKAALTTTAPSSPMNIAYGNRHRISIVACAQWGYPAFLLTLDHLLKQLDISLECQVRLMMNHILEFRDKAWLTIAD